MKYQLLYKGSYLNSFKTYSQAVEERERLERRGFKLEYLEIKPID